MADPQDTQNASLSAYQEYVREVTKERGFDDETVSQKFMLLLEEAGEFAQTARKVADIKARTDRSQEDLADGAGDVFAILLDICNKLDIDLEQAFLQKEQKNQARTWE